MDYSVDFEKLNRVSREDYIKVYNKLGKKMFSECDIPTVFDFANIGETESLDKIKHISEFTGNTKDIINSIKRREANYTEEESSKFMNSVIASNVTDITESGYFYKKLISSCDNMKITEYDCGSEGYELQLPIDENIYNYKVRFHTISEFGMSIDSYKRFCRLTKDKSIIHVRNFLNCKTDPNHRCFCEKCAGTFKKSEFDSFMPYNIGVYSTLMVTEHATQASLDSMNKGVSEKINKILETKLDQKAYPDYESVKEKIEQIINHIGNIGVMSKFYEISLLSRFYVQKDGTYKPISLQTSFLQQGDKLGNFIYRPTKTNFLKLIGSKNIKADSLKSKIMMDIYD